MRTGGSNVTEEKGGLPWEAGWRVISRRPPVQPWLIMCISAPQEPHASDPRGVRSHWKRPPAICHSRGPSPDLPACPRHQADRGRAEPRDHVPSRIIPRRSPSRTSLRSRASRSATARWAWWTCPGAPSASALPSAAPGEQLCVTPLAQIPSSAVSGSSPTRRDGARPGLPVGIRGSSRTSTSTSARPKGFPCLKKTESSLLPRCLGKSKGRTHVQIDPEVIDQLRGIL